LFHGEYENAVQNLTDGLQLSRSINDLWQQALYTTFLGTLLTSQGNFSEASRLFRESLRTFLTLGDPRMIILSADNLSKTVQPLGGFEDVQALYDKGIQATPLREDDIDTLLLLREGVSHLQNDDDAWLQLHALNLEGKIAVAEGQRDNAYVFFNQAGEIAMATQALPMFLDALAQLAKLEMQEERYGQAFEWVIHILGNSASSQYTRNSAEKLRKILESKLSRQEIEAIKLRAQSITLETIAERLSLK